MKVLLAMFRYFYGCQHREHQSRVRLNGEWQSNSVCLRRDTC